MPLKQKSKHNSPGSLGSQLDSQGKQEMGRTWKTEDKLGKLKNQQTKLHYHQAPLLYKESKAVINKIRP